MRLALLISALLLAAASSPAAERSVRYSGRTMGTWGHVQLVTADSLASLPVARSALDAFARVDSLMSAWSATSELARLNREGYPGPVSVDPELLAVLRISLRIGRESAGAFDITVQPLVRLWGFLDGTPHVPRGEEIQALMPRIGQRWIDLRSSGETVRFLQQGLQLDLGGVAKGYAVDRAVQTLRDAGVTDALVDLAGNMAALGSPADRESWVVGVRDPEQRDRWFARLVLGKDAVATSGDYERFVSAEGRRYGHVLDPRTGWPADELRSATVLAPTATEADAWATALFVLGDAGRELLVRHPELSAILVESSERELSTVWVSRSLQSRFALEPQEAGRFELRWF